MSTTRGLRPVPQATMFSHMLGVSYLWEGEYSWLHATPVMLYMALGILALWLNAGRMGSWWVGAGVAWAVETGPKPRPASWLRRRRRSAW
jgi:hypothetical protein